MTTLDLNTLTDDEINAAVAEYVAGFERHGHTGLWAAVDGKSCGYVDGRLTVIPDYLNDANVLIFFLDKADQWTSINKLTVGYWGYTVSVCAKPPVTWKGEADTFCRAACIALLCASGKVKVIG